MGAFFSRGQRPDVVVKATACHVEVHSPLSVFGYRRNKGFSYPRVKINIVGNLETENRSKWRDGRAPDCLARYVWVPGSNPADPVWAYSEMFLFLSSQLD